MPATIKAASLGGLSPCSCNLEAPANLQTVRLSTTFADISWSAINGAAGYKVKLFKKVGNNFVFVNEVNNFSTSMTISGLTAGAEHLITVAGMCLSEMKGIGWEVSSNVSMLPFPKVILDLDVNLYLPLTGYPIEGAIENGQCCFYYFSDANGNRIWVKVIERSTDYCNAHPVFFYQFKVRLGKATDQNNIQCAGLLRTQNIGYLNSQIIPIPNMPLDYAVIRDQKEQIKVEVVKIERFGDLNDTRIRITNLDPEHYEFQCYEAPLGFGIPTDDRTKASSFSKINIYPLNPFLNSLDVFIANPTDLPLRLQLLDLSGQIIATQQYIAGQSNLSLPTAHLLPGLYLLRLESEGETQTFKVIKV